MGKGQRAADWLGGVAGSVDLRRARDAGMTERVLARAGWLESGERTLVEAVFRDGRSVAALARAAGREPREMRRLVARAVERLLDDRAAFVARRMGDWPAARARAAREIFLNGCSLREASRRLGISLHSTRVHRDAVEGMYEAERAALKRAQRTGLDRGWR